MRLISLGLAALCVGCVTPTLEASNDRDPLEMTAIERPAEADLGRDLPETTAIARPENAEAARLLDAYLAEMDKTLFLTGELSRLRDRDSHARRIFIETFRDPDLDPDVREAFQDAGGAYIAELDAIHTAQLKDLMSDMDWRTLAGLGGNLFDSAFLIVQHTSDFAYQEAVLEEIEPLALEGLIDGEKFALMYDRVQLRNTDTQLYGTQADCVNGQYDVIGLTDPDTVDARRAEMGMEPLAPYLDRLREIYGTCGDG